MSIKKAPSEKMVRQRMVATSRQDEMIRLRETGLTLAEIARRQTPPITAERVRQILKPVSRGKPDLDSKLMLRTGEVSQLLGLHVNTVRLWSRKGILKSYRVSPRGDRRFKREDVECLLTDEYAGKK